VCIAIAQLAALAYGIHAVSLARPVYLTFTVDRFDLVTAKDLDPADLEQVTRPEFKAPPLGRPRYAAAVLPADRDEKERILNTSLQGKDLQMYPQYYAPYEQEVPNALKRAAPLDRLMKLDAPAVESYLKAAGRTADSVKYLPLRAPNKDGAVLLDAKSGQPLEILLIEAW
jgi:hypothetical protein